MFVITENLYALISPHCTLTNNSSKKYSHFSSAGILFIKQDFVLYTWNTQQNIQQRFDEKTPFVIRNFISIHRPSNVSLKDAKWHPRPVLALPTANSQNAKNYFFRTFLRTSHHSFPRFLKFS